MEIANDLTHQLSVALAAGGQRVADQVRAAARALEATSGELRALGEKSIARSAEAVRLCLASKISAEDCEVALGRELDGLELLPAALLEKGGSEGIKATKAALTHVRDVVLPVVAKLALIAI